MKKLLLILICLFVSFEVKSLELNLVCKFVDFWGRTKSGDQFVSRNDLSDQSGSDGFIILKNRRINSNLMFSYHGEKVHDEISVLNETDSEIFVKVYFLNDTTYHTIFIDRYTGKTRVRESVDGTDIDQNFRIWNYSCSKGTRKF